ncbi:MAG: chemotaxis protein CheR [Deltaproteobacteria bacterium]|nr:chemotaxis protein CheR [Deltaproteobacteria bacterium]
MVYEICGISLANTKRTMLSVRLLRRLRALNLSSFEDYLNLLESLNRSDDELQAFLNVVTTNKTDFYRENYHFEFLKNHVLPELQTSRKISVGVPLHIWSAGCSSGEEPYTIAMEVAEVLGAINGRFEILATDISTKVLHSAIQGIYSEQEIMPIPQPQKYKYLMHGAGEQKGFYRFVPEIRKHITFGRMNFVADDYGIPQRMHVIFCRNVLIYFDAETRHAILQKLCAQLTARGYLFLGHSESIKPNNFRLEKISPTIYRRLH